MNSNPAIQNVATVTWDGTTSKLYDISKFVRFGVSFEVVTTLTSDAVLKFVSAPPSAGDPCVPGTPEDVEAIAICTDAYPAGTLAQITIPSGTVAGTVCSATIPCYPDKFVGIASVSGNTANVRAILVRQGPMT